MEIEKVLNDEVNFDNVIKKDWRVAYLAFEVIYNCYMIKYTDKYSKTSPSHHMELIHKNINKLYTIKNVEFKIKMKNKVFLDNFIENIKKNNKKHKINIKKLAELFETDKRKVELMHDMYLK